MNPEALARLLDHSEWCCGNENGPGQCSDESCQNYRESHAERILADPTPLLAALAEAGVLTEEEEYRWDQTTYDRKTPQHRYTTDWTEVTR